MSNSRELPLTSGRFAFVDEADFIRVNAFRWYELKRPGRSSYGYRRNGSKTIYLHRYIMDAPDGMDVDHRDGDGLNCRRENLRVCTHAQNQMNYRKCTKPTSSRYKGVRWDKSRNLWIAAIKVNWRSRFIGRFASEDDAARAYDQKARELFGEFACLNFPEVANA